MLSAKLLTELEHMCRAVRNVPVFFGGLQVVLSGDFLQLAPVPNVLYNDQGQFAFNSPVWNEGFGHVVHLKQVYRQDDQALIKVTVCCY